MYLINVFFYSDLHTMYVQTWYDYLNPAVVSALLCFGVNGAIEKSYKTFNCDAKTIKIWHPCKHTALMCSTSSWWAHRNKLMSAAVWLSCTKPDYSMLQFLIYFALELTRPQRAFKSTACQTLFKCLGKSSLYINLTYLDIKI